jgi:hypothetical protein
MLFTDRASLVSPGFFTLAEAISAVTEWLMGELGSKTAMEHQAKYREPDEAAKSMIFEGFRDGKLSSYLETKKGKIRKISKQDWLAPHGAVLVAVERDSRREIITVLGPEGYVSGRVVVREVDIEKFLAPANVDEKSTPSRGPGRDPKYDSDGFLIEVFRIMFEGRRRPETQAELIRLASGAYANAHLPGGKPHYDWAKKKVSRVWRELGLGVNADE